jgi:hypothetical protein
MSLLKEVLANRKTSKVVASPPGPVSTSLSAAKQDQPLTSGSIQV